VEVPSAPSAVIAQALTRIQPTSTLAGTAAATRQSELTKPPGSLGRLEDLATRIAAIRDEARPHLEQRLIVVAAGDHGVTSQGVSAWPSDEPNLVGLCDEAEIPLPDSSIDRVLMVHALETSEQVRPLLREVWRVLASGGRLMVVVPNRRGIWARVERTPFGTGSPFSPPQLERLMRDSMFSPTATLSALFFPPTQRRSLIRLAPAFENLGNRWAHALSGVLISEAGKQIFAATAQQAPRTRRIRQPQVAFPRSAAPRSGPNLTLLGS